MALLILFPTLFPSFLSLCLNLAFLELALQIDLDLRDLHASVSFKAGIKGKYQPAWI